MNLRFRRSIRILPGVRINLSKSGLSATVGSPGAHVTIGSKGSRTTVGVPGTGLSISESTTHAAGADSTAGGGSSVSGILWILLFLAILMAVIVALGS